MSLFQCENCGCCENTALSSQGFRVLADIYDWTRIEDRKGMLLCSACGPERFCDGEPTLHGTWHKEFDRVFLNKGQFKTNKDGNLEHIETGRTDYKSFALPVCPHGVPHTQCNYCSW